MHALLKKIVTEKQKEVKRLRSNGIPRHRTGEVPTLRDFKGALAFSPMIDLIAEIKFASPSEGVICKGVEPAAVGRMYEAAGAAAVSVVTDRTFFRGELANLPVVKKEIGLPILRKDFIIDEIQVMESLRFGADAILLIVRMLSRQQLKDLHDLSQELGLAALTEVHDRDDLEAALEIDAPIIGINNRNLDTMKVDLSITRKLAPLIPKGRVIVSESGIRAEKDVRSLHTCGIQAVLVGTSLMKSDQVQEQARKLVLAGKSGARKS